jgi:hypothetical protein
LESPTPCTGIRKNRTTAKPVIVRFTRSASFYSLSRPDHIINTGCWIKEDKLAQLLTEYVWMWVSALVMAILYGIMFLVMRGFLIVDNGVRWAKRRHRVRPDLSGGDDEEERAARAMANLLLL